MSVGHWIFLGLMVIAILPTIGVCIFVHKEMKRLKND